MSDILIDLSDMQGLLQHGYAKLRYANYILLQFGEDQSRTRSWIKKLLPEIKDAAVRPETGCLNMAFGRSGLEKLGISVNSENGFSRSFIEGIDTDHRNRILGDYQFNASDKWNWGGRNRPEIDVLLMSFEPDKANLEEKLKALQADFDDHQLSLLYRIESVDLGTKEHFGFEDGLSQPVMRGSGKVSCDKDMVNPGEFIFGYDNEYRKRPLAPKLNGFDFGINGSYMVFRQLQQDVKGFWGFLRSVANDDEHAIYLGAKMLGRWPDGKPFGNVSMQSTEGCPKDNNFLFDPEDLSGHGCPVGSHIRRTNPRDSIDGDPEQSLMASNKHRILRRGRPYGAPFSSDLKIEEMIQKDDDGVSRGLNFICFNTNLERQFEFIQQTWCNNKKFDGLYEVVDPIVGVKGNGREVEKTQFKIPESRFRKRIVDIPIFVEVKGAAYFLFPGIKAIKHLAGEK